MGSKISDAIMLTCHLSQDTGKVFGGCRSTSKVFVEGGGRGGAPGGSITTHYMGTVIISLRGVKEVGEMKTQKRLFNIVCQTIINGVLVVWHRGLS